MDKIEARFRIVTPMFISGADQTKAELRVPSIKGALRFWWRALNYKEEPKRLLEMERNLFGSSDKNFGQSKISMSLKNVNLKSTKIQNKWNVNDWRAYVGYGLSEDQSGKKRENIYRSFLEPDGTFSLIMGSKGDLSTINDTLKSFSLLGGLGSRSRNGWGSISITGIDSKWQIPTSREDYTSQLCELLALYRHDEKIPSYSAISKNTEIKIGPCFNNYFDAFKDISEKYKAYVKELRPKDKREGFGSPRKGISDDRRGSPLFIHLHNTGNQFFWVATFMKSKFNERNEEPRLGYEPIHNFMDEIGGDRI